MHGIADVITSPSTVAALSPATGCRSMPLQVGEPALGPVVWFHEGCLGVVHSAIVKRFLASGLGSTRLGVLFLTPTQSWGACLMLRTVKGVGFQMSTSLLGCRSAYHTPEVGSRPPWSVPLPAREFSHDGERSAVGTPGVSIGAFARKPSAALLMCVFSQLHSFVLVLSPILVDVARDFDVLDRGSRSVANLVRGTRRPRL